VIPVGAFDLTASKAGSSLALLRVFGMTRFIYEQHWRGWAMSIAIGDLMAMAEVQEWRARDAAWWRNLTRKRRGEMAEAAFLHKASRLGFAVAKPWGDSEPYDLIVDGGGKLWKVQVKSAYRAGEYGGYTFHAYGNEHKKAYSLKDIDVLVAYIVPEDLWYVLPITVFRGIKGMKLFPSSRRRISKYEVYREAWGFLGENEPCGLVGRPARNRGKKSDTSMSITTVSP
jgi:hypothetical protein